MINEKKMLNKKTVVENIVEDTLRLKRDLEQTDLEKAYEKGYFFGKKEKQIDTETVESINVTEELNALLAEEQAPILNSRFEQACKKRSQK